MSHLQGQPNCGKRVAAEYTLIMALVTDMHSCQCHPQPAKNISGKLSVFVGKQSPNASCRYLILNRGHDFTSKHAYNSSLCKLTAAMQLTERRMYKQTKHKHMCRVSITIIHLKRKLALYLLCYQCINRKTCEWNAATVECKSPCRDISIMLHMWHRCVLPTRLLSEAAG